MEAALDLNAHPRAHPPHLACYPHQRTADRIGSLTRLTRQAAKPRSPPSTTAPNTPPKPGLDNIRLDHLAETHHRPGTTTTKSRTPGR
ncbi:hypothetical protein [Embleya sp. NBC_00896]|uniref:hypothetical protein n=1 Tax=Embleya sp. NBC_00896 TaxID=2975961 RepID=UPI0038661E03|nr:hypothetical protein OG928_00490 [Embleya sp. NBC_00896]